MTTLHEADIEQIALDQLRHLGWHTQRSGKSLTMARFADAFARRQDLLHDRMPEDSPIRPERRRSGARRESSQFRMCQYAMVELGGLEPPAF